MANVETQVLRTGVGLDTRDFAKFAKALRIAAPDLAKQLRLGLRAVGQIVAEDAKSRVSEYSQSIPPSIKVRVSGVGVAVVAGGLDVPLAALFEVGNKGKGGGDTFRHPVFDNKAVWVDQPMHPYLDPALRANLAVVDVEVNKALDDVVGKL